YASAWLKVHHPEAFYAALLAAQPMGFYSPASLVEDARRRGVSVERARVDVSGVHAEVHGERGALFVQLGLAPIKGIGQETAEAIGAERGRERFTGMGDLARRCRLSTAQLEPLATAGALSCFEAARRGALWAAGAHGGAAGIRRGGFTQPALPIEVGATAPALRQMDD